MPIRKGTFGSAVVIAPTVTISSTTNFNQDRATFNATVTPNAASATVYFDYSTSSTFATFSTVTYGTVTSTSTIYSNVTGLSVGTLYYVRCRADAGGGVVGTSSSTSFTTWSFQVYERSTSGGTTFTIPTVTPTGGSAIAVSIYDIIMFGGGGGGSFYGGGGGGGYQDVASRSVTGSRSVTTSVGAGGAAATGNGSGSIGNDTTISGDLTTLTAAYGGGGGQYFTTDGYSGTGWISGISATYDTDPNDKSLPNEAWGGGGGAAATGGNGTANASTTVGGTGGPGVSITSGGVTRAGGAGGGGAAYIYTNSGSQGSRGNNNTYGSGGNSTSSGGGAGQAGYIRFRYYAASALA